MVFTWLKLVKNYRSIFMKAFRTLTLSILFCAILCTQALAQGVMCGKKINSFDFVVDYSGSMMMSAEEIKESKINIAKTVLSRLNSVIPQLDYYGGMHTLAPTVSLLNQGLWDRASMANTIAKLHDDLPIYGRMTPLGSGLRGYEPWIASMNRNAAIIISTDGDNNRGVNLVDVVRGIYAAQRDIVVHIISYADTATGKDVIAQIAALNPNTIVADGLTLAANDQALNQFAMDIWCDQEEEVIVLRGVNFAFDSTKLDANARAILDEAARIIKTATNKQVMLNGWTDTIGTDSYNTNLSQRRADSVKKYLSEQGVPAMRMDSHGRGKSRKYDNKNEDGRYLNRRVELVFE